VTQRVCKKLDSCVKIDMAMDKDMLDLQVAELVRKVCSECEQFEQAKDLSLRVFLLCGGAGTRLFPFTTLIPKALLPIGGRPVLAWIVRDLYSHGLRDIVVLANKRFEDQFRYHASAMEAHYKLKINFGFSVNSEDLGTAGEILSVKDMVTDTFMVYYGDIITELEFEDLIGFHKDFSPEPLGTLAVSKSLKVPKGVVETDGGVVKNFVEKPSIPLKTWCGVAVFKPEIINYINMGDDFSLDVIPKALKDGEKLGTYLFEEEYLDIGDLENYKRAHQFLSKGSWKGKK